MKTTQYPLRTILPLLAGLLVAPIVSAAPVLWSGAGGDDNWSTPGNWSGGTPAGNEVFFGELDATGSSGPFGTANNIVNSSLDISRLSYTNQITVGYHTTEISSGVTLTLTNSGNTILVNQPGINVADAQVYATVLGAGTLNATNPAGVISIGQGSATANSSRRATLDLSGLATFNATLGRIILGQQLVHSNRANATLLLARTNFIDLAQAAPTPGLLLGDLQSNNGNSQSVGLGITNVILSDSGLTIGGRKGNGVLQFNSTLVLPGEGTVRFRARDNAGRQSQWRVGDNSGQNGGGTFAVGVVDFSTYGSVDALVDTLTLGWGTAGTASTSTPSDGTLSFDAGTVDVNNLRLGVQPNTGGGRARGTVNVNGTGQLIVNGDVLMGAYTGGTYISLGLINIGSISGGAVTILGDVICGGGVGNQISSFGALTLGGKLGDAVNATNTPLETLDLWAGSITFDLGSDSNPVSALANVTNLNVNGSVTVQVKGNNVSVGQFPLFQYYSGLGDVGGFVGFSGLSLALPNKVEGYLSNNTANASVDVVITNVTNTKWSGLVNGNWDINTTLNWTNFPGGTATKYQETSVPGDAVTFDDSAAGTTTVNLTTTLSPDGILVNNPTKIYTFNGSGALSGPTGLTKQGAGTLILANSGANTFTGPVAIEGGTVQLSGSDDRVPTNSPVTLADVASAALDLNGRNQTLAALNGGGAVGGNVLLGAGTLTVNGDGGIYAGVISGAGAVIKTGTGEQVLLGANVHLGGIEVQGGTLTLANTTGSGAGPGSVAVTTTNGVLRLGDGGANGSVAVGTIPNEGVVVLNRSDDLTFTTLLTGGGSFRKENTNNTVTLAISQSYTGATEVVAGALRVTHAGALGDTTGVTTIQNGTTARLELSGDLTLLEPLSIAQKQTAAGNVPGVLNLSGTNTLAGPIELPAGGSYWTIQSAAGKLVVSGPTTNNTTVNVRTLWLSGAGDGEWNTGLANGISPATAALRKDGTGTWKLGSTVTYTGSTVVSNGTLVVNGTIANSSGVTVAAGTLAGTGYISAPVTVATDGNLAPGDGGIGKLSVFNNVTLSGTTTMELAKSGLVVTNDQVSVLTTLTQGGTLDVSLTGTVGGGEVFQLFTAGTFAGAFDVLNLPALPGALTWDTSNLAVNGTLAISSAAPTLGVSQSGNVLTFSWSGAGLKLQAQTNSLNVGLSNNWFDYPGGETSGVSATINPANAAVFFRLISQ
jgi:autotransporter-associated beta strand protein